MLELTGNSNNLSNRDNGRIYFQQNKGDKTMIPTREDIKNILTHCYKNNKLDRNLFSAIFIKDFLIKLGDTVNSYIEITSIVEYDTIIEITVEYFNNRDNTNYVFKFQPNELEDQNG